MTRMEYVTCNVCLGYFIFDFAWCLFFQTEGKWMQVSFDKGGHAKQYNDSNMEYDSDVAKELLWFDATAQKGWSRGGTNLYKGQSVSMATGTFHFLKGMFIPKGSLVEKNPWGKKTPSKNLF